MSRYLITTADETTWKFDRPVLFLGKWCTNENRRHIWSKLDYSVLDPSTINNSLSEYYQRTQDLYELLSIDFSSALNDFHRCSHAERYWHIIIGPWLRSFCNILVFRWVYLTSANSLFEIDGSNLTANKKPDGVHPRNFAEYRKCTKDNMWSQHIYSAIWNSIDVRSNRNGRVDAHLHDKPTTMSPINTSSKLPRTTSRRIILVDPYLPRRSEIALRLLTGSMRLRVPRIDAPLVQKEPAARATLTFDDPAVSQLHQIGRDLVIDQMPSAYVEGYRLLVESTTKLKLPSSPGVIYTANRHLYDDVFNAWVAQATEHGSSYVIGQHGGHYGSSRFRSDSEIHEEQVSDVHLTWGWKYSEKQLPGPCITKVGQKYRPYVQAKHLLIVCDNMWTNPRSLFYDIPEHVGYLEYVAQCVKGLPPEISTDVLVRLNHAHAETGSSQIEWWKTHAPTTNVDDGLSDMQDVVRKSRLIVTTYNGTTFLETLNLNIPTLVTWDKSYVQLRQEALPYFQRLEEAGIFHSNDQSFVDHVTRHWDNIESWWVSDVVQSARLVFCNQFSGIHPHSLLFLRRLLRTANSTKNSRS